MITTEQQLLAQLSANHLAFATKNKRLWEYYDGEAGVKNMGIAIPESLADVEAVVGWPEIIVDALAERLEFSGWRSSADIADLEGVFAENQLGVEVSKAILDSLVTGVGFLAVTEGASGEPRIVVDAVPSTQATYVWDERLNRMQAGFVARTGVDGERIVTLYLPDTTVVFVNGGEVSRIDHGRGRCGLVALPNRARAGAFRGRSEINKTIRYYTDHGVRTILGMEYNREFYTTPQRYLLGVTPEQLGLDEEPSDRELLELGWKVAQNKALIVPPGEPEDGGGKPTAGQFQAAAPTPYIDELKMLAQLVSAQASVPANYLGFVHENPPSADAIRAQEARLVKKAEARQALFGQVLTQDLAFLCLAILRGPLRAAQVLPSVQAVWREASTPTLAATMDAMVKSVSAGIFPVGSEVIWDKLGVTESEKQIMRRELALQRAAQVAQALSGAVGTADQPPLADPNAGIESFIPGVS